MQATCSGMVTTRLEVELLQCNIQPDLTIKSSWIELKLNSNQVERQFMLQCKSLKKKRKLMAVFLLNLPCRKIHYIIYSYHICSDLENGLHNMMEMDILHLEENILLHQQKSASEYLRSSQWFYVLMLLLKFLVTFMVNIKT